MRFLVPIRTEHPERCDDYTSLAVVVLSLVRALAFHKSRLESLVVLLLCEDAEVV